MGTPKSVHDRVSSTLERLERLMGDHDGDIEHPEPDTVEDALRKLKGKLPEKQLRLLGD